MKKKKDVKQLVAIIPPASQILTREGPRQKEKRVRLKLRKKIPSNELHISSVLVKELGIGVNAEISVAGKKRLKFKAIVDGSVPENEVWGNEELMREKGLADNSLVTLRGA